VRPLNAQETSEGVGWRIDNNTLNQVDQNNRDVERITGSKYTLHNVFGADSRTKDVYKVTTEPVIQKVVNGFNGTVFAYGQTSSGKTFTMRGSAAEPGIVPLAVYDIFKTIDDNMDREYLLRVSYIEVRVHAMPTSYCYARSKSSPLKLSFPLYTALQRRSK
jgi:centromeric protein E